MTREEAEEAVVRSLAARFDVPSLRAEVARAEAGEVSWSDLIVMLDAVFPQVLRATADELVRRGI